MNSQISAIINTKNEAKTLGRCLESLKKQLYQNLDIIIIDNHSNDETLKIAREYTDKIFTKGPERSSQKNLGAKKAGGQHLFFVDADMTMGKNVISEAISLFNKNSKVKAIVVPEITQGNTYWAQVRALERSCYLNSPIEAARIFEKKAFFEVGGFDPALYAAEDWDLHQRIEKLGQIGRTKDQIIHHEENLSLLDDLKKKYYYAKNIHLYARKHPQVFKTRSGKARIKIMLENWPKLVADPVHTLGIPVLKSLEYLVYLLAKS